MSKKTKVAKPKKTKEITPEKPCQCEICKAGENPTNCKNPNGFRGE
jgi:hypothetical protein